jgi:hypothetical protein
MTPTTTLASGGEDLTLDAGLVRPARLGDYVWEDSDGDGVQDAAEEGVEGVTVHLKDAGGTIIDTTTTDANGEYLFENLKPGTYSVQFEEPAGYEFTDADQGGDDALDSDADVSTGMTPTTTLASGGEDLTLDAGILQRAALGDRVWLDLDQDGVQDAGEAGVADVTVNLLDAGGAVLATQQTDANGLYLFDDLLPGDYAVEFVKPSGYDFTVQDAGGDDAIDSDADTTTGRTIVYSLESGETDRTVDAGLVEIPPELASLGDYVWHDLPGGADNEINGLQDAGEPGIEGVVVNLLDNGGAFLASTLTDATGFYEFVDLNPGAYIVEVAPSNFAGGGALEGYYITMEDQGADDAVDSDGDASGRSHVVTLDPGEHDPTIDFGYLKTCIDLVKTGPESVIAGDTITYTFTVTNCGDVLLDGGAHVYDPMLNPHGNHEIWFGDLEPGESVTFTRTYDTSAASTITKIDFDDLATGEIVTDQYAAHGVHITTLSPAHHPAMIFDSASPTGGDWDLGTPNEDFGGPGRGWGGEAGRPGENANPLGKVLILSEDGDQNDPDDDARGGTFVFTFDDPVDVERVGVIDIDCREDGELRTYDAGGTLIGSVPIVSLGNNSVQVLGVFADDVSRMEVELSSSGAITGLCFGEPECGELVNVATAKGHPVRPDGQRLPIVTDVDDHVVDIVCEPAQTASLGDYVWHDLPGGPDNEINGLQDAGEPGIEGVVVNLLDSGGSIIATDTTDADGFYLFEDLAAGDYVVEIAPENFEDGAVLDGWYLTMKDVGGNDSVDSDGDFATQRSDVVTLDAGEDDRSVDFGYFFTCVDLTKTGPDEVNVGDTITYEFTIRNCGDVVLHGGAHVFDPMLNPCGNHKIWSGVVHPGESYTFTKTYKTDQDDCGELVNVATALGHPVRPDGLNLDKVRDKASHTVTVVCEPSGGEGCTPGFWKQWRHYKYWEGYKRWDRFEKVFGVDASCNVKLIQALRARGGGEAALMRHAVAGLLNAASSRIDYAFTPAQVIAMVQHAYATGDFEGVKDVLETEHERGCEVKDGCSVRRTCWQRGGIWMDWWRQCQQARRGRGRGGRRWRR